jgi:hypothetical protein
VIDVRSPQNFRQGVGKSDAWGNDSTFKKRWMNGKEPTPYVLNNRDQVLWDLSITHRGPRQGDMGGLDGMVLVEADRWIEYAHSELRMAWAAPNRTTAIISVGSIVWLACEQASDADHVCLMVHTNPASVPRPRSALPTNSDAVTISISFSQHNYEALWDLCTFIEHTCGRVLAPAAEMAAQEVLDASNSAPGPADAARPAHSGMPVTGTDEPANLAEPGRAAGPDRAAQFAPATVATLAVTVERVPDTPEWLSFAAPTAEDLLGEPTIGTLQAPRSDTAQQGLPDSFPEVAPDPPSCG